MVTIKEFIETQNSILEKDFIGSEVGKTGTVPLDYLSNGKGKIFYGALLRHPDYISLPVEEFSYKISGVVPSLACPSADVHTGVVVYTGNEDGSIVLRKLTEVAYKAGKEMKRPSLKYDQWFCNANSVVTASMRSDAVDEAFVSIINGLLGSYEGASLERKKLAQITSNRFTEQRTPEEMKEFFELMKNAPVLGESRSKVLDVIKQTVTGDSSTIEIYERFRLL